MTMQSRRLLLGLLSLALLPVGCGEPPADQAVESSSHELKIGNVVVGAGTPTGTNFKGSLWLAYTGTDGNIHTLQRTGPNSFIDRKTVFFSNMGPSLTVYHDKLYLTWSDVPFPLEGSRFIAKKSSDGIQWQNAISNTNELPAVKFAPGMVVYFDQLLAFATWGGSSSIVMQFNYDEGTNRWTHVFNTSLATTIGPSAAMLGPDLFVAAVDGNGEVRTQKYDNTHGGGWQSPNFVGRRERVHLITAGTSTPSLLLLGSQVGSVGPNQIHFDRTFDGANLVDLGVIGDTTKERPHGISANDSSVELVYRGTNNGLYLINVGLPAN